MVILIGRGSTVGFENAISVMPAYIVSHRGSEKQNDMHSGSFLARLCTNGPPSEMLFP